MCEDKEKNKKSCILTENGRKKLNDALSKKYPNHDYNYQELANETNINREVISEIINDRKKSSLRKKLDDLFSFLNIDLDDNDYYNPPKIKTNKKSNIDIPLSNEEIIKKALEGLNYRIQINKFNDFLDLENNLPVGAFLIHGKSGYGQRWLINRLCFEEPHFSNAKHETLPLKRYRNNIHALWQELAKKFGSNSDSPEDIIEAIYKHWQSQTVIICFSHFNEKEICGNYLNYLISHFWQPLVTKTKNHKSPQYSLLLFFIDETGCNKNNFGIQINQNFNVNTPWIICELDKLSCFQNQHLTRWLNLHKNIFEPIVKDKTLEIIFNEILTYNQTPEEIPENVLDKVCSYFNLTWHDIETTLPLQIKGR